MITVFNRCLLLQELPEALPENSGSVIFDSDIALLLIVQTRIYRRTTVRALTQLKNVIQFLKMSRIVTFGRGITPGPNRLRQMTKESQKHTPETSTALGALGCKRTIAALSASKGIHGLRQSLAVG